MAIDDDTKCIYTICIYFLKLNYWLINKQSLTAANSTHFLNSLYDGFLGAHPYNTTFLRYPSSSSPSVQSLPYPWTIIAIQVTLTFYKFLSTCCQVRSLIFLSSKFPSFCICFISHHIVWSIWTMQEWSTITTFLTYLCEERHRNSMWRLKWWNCCLAVSVLFCFFF